jgi:hypothetical protein
MSNIVQLHPMNIGSGFRAYSLRGGEMAEPIDPFLGVDHAWISTPTFQSHPPLRIVEQNQAVKE